MLYGNEVLNMTDFLFARPSLLEGVSRILDFGGSLQKYNISRSPEEADTKAIYNDFRAVGGDMAYAIHAYGASQGKTK